MHSFTVVYGVICSVTFLTMGSQHPRQEMRKRKKKGNERESRDPPKTHDDHWNRGKAKVLGDLSIHAAGQVLLLSLLLLWASEKRTRSVAFRAETPGQGFFRLLLLLSLSLSLSLSWPALPQVSSLSLSNHPAFFRMLFARCWDSLERLIGRAES